MGEDCRLAVDILCLTSTIGSLVSLLLCGLLVSRPNFHGAKFEIGTCELTTQHIDIDEAPLKSCDCSGEEEGCYSVYPCVNAYGIFYKKGSSETGTKGTFHYGYEEVKAGCLLEPACTPSYSGNEAQVSRFWDAFKKIWTNHTYVECWGSGDNFYLWMNYSLAKAYMGVLIPTGIFFLSIFIAVIFGSSVWAKVFCFPCFFLCDCIYSKYKRLKVYRQDKIAEKAKKAEEELEEIDAETDNNEFFA